MRGTAAWLLMAGALFAQVAEIPFEGNIDFLKWPAHLYAGEIAGVATTSKGNILVYSRTGESATVGGSRLFTHGGSRLFEFDPAGRYIREIGQGVYGFLFAQCVRVDAQDNIWVVDRGSNMVLKFDQGGHVLLVLGRKPESVSLETPGRGGRGNGAGVPGDNFNRPTDVAFDAAGNIFVADAYANARIAKFDKDGRFLKSWGTRGQGPGEFDMPGSLAVDAHGEVYVADRGNKRIQVFDNNGVFKRQIAGVGSPWAVCISPGSHQYLFSSNSNPPDSLDHGEIYRMELDGTASGRFGKAGKLVKEFGTVNELDCRNPQSLYVGEVTNWRIQKIALH